MATPAPCVNCNNLALGLQAGSPCLPCEFFTDGRPPSHWAAMAPPTAAPHPDTVRLEWLMSLMSFDDDPMNLGNLRTQALTAAFQLGKDGRDAIDYAREGSP